MLAILGDINHHLTAWPDKRHRVRLIAVIAFAWVLFGAWQG
jgi:hypothetical protein